MDRIIRWLRVVGLAPFGFAQEDFHGHHQLLRVWGPLLPARWEVYRWPTETGTDEKDRWLRPLPSGSPEMRHRIQLTAELVYSGTDWHAAKRAFAGRYPDGTTDVSRPPVMALHLAGGAR